MGATGFRAVPKVSGTPVLLSGAGKALAVEGATLRSGEQHAALGDSRSHETPPAL
jgi:hypothetical protein